MTESIVQVRRVVKDWAGQDELRGSGLTYRYGSRLRVGDRVMCPATDFGGPFIAEVTQLGSDYQGHVKPLLCRVAPDRLK